MNSQSIIKSAIYSSSTIPEKLLIQYGNLRYKCFRKDDPNVNMDHFRSVELDAFDKEASTSYIFVTERCPKSRDEKLISGVRLLPTAKDYELEMSSYKYLTSGISLPKSLHIMEGNRWVGRSSSTSIGKISTGLLLMTIYQFAQAMQIEKIIGTITTQGESWLSKRKISLNRCSPVYEVKEEDIKILISEICIDKNMIDIARNIFIDGMQEISITDINIMTNIAA